MVNGERELATGSLTSHVTVFVWRTDPSKADQTKHHLKTFFDKDSKMSIETWDFMNWFRETLEEKFQVSWNLS